MPRDYKYSDEFWSLGYRPADKFIVVNDDDPDLHKVKITLPDPPKSIELVEGYGEDAMKQKFKREEYPFRLKQLQSECDTIEEIWYRLEGSPDYYSSEIEWIRRMWYYRIYGKWYFINGVPTWITGTHWLFLNFFPIDIGLADYRSRDRRFFLFTWFIENDTMIPVLDNKGYPVEDDEGFLILEDTKRRVCIGFNYLKHRREGATSKASCKNVDLISSHLNYKGGIQSLDGDSAEMVFLEHVVVGWRGMPFFFRPQVDGTTNPKTSIKFDSSGRIIKGGAATMDRGLQSKIDYADSAGKSKYDGKKLHFYHDDEAGKVLLENINLRHGVVNKCLTQANGALIHGLTIKTSTVGEMNNAGGKNYFDLCQKSHYESRNKNGQTLSGLYNLFIPAHDGLDGFIDRFGNSIIDYPEEWQIKDMDVVIKDDDGLVIGARKYIENVREALMAEGTPKAMIDLNENVRQHPVKWRECWIAEAGDTGLDIRIISDRLKDLRFMPEASVTGNFMWSDGFGSNVLWIPDPKGRWILSHKLNPEEQNRKIKRGEMWFPDNGDIFVSGADPFKYGKTATTRISDGGLATVMNRDKSIDHDNIDPRDWKTYNLVCTYQSRPPTVEAFAEDALMQCIFFGSGMYPETNIPAIVDYFDVWGYGGYLIYDIDIKTKRFKTMPGMTTGTANQQDLWNATRDYISMRGHMCNHKEYLSDCQNIMGVEDMTHYDRWTAVALALKACRTQMILGERKEKQNTDYNMEDFLIPHTY